MKQEKVKGFFCVVYFESKKTGFYHSQWNPARLAKGLRNPYIWLKVFMTKDEYLADKNNYKAIFDKDNPIQEFTFAPYYGKTFK